MVDEGCVGYFCIYDISIGGFMKRLLVFLVLISLTAAFAMADSEGSMDKRNRGSKMYVTIHEAMGAFLEEHRETAIGDITFGDIESYMAEISVPLQEAAYVRRMSSASRMAAGAGQFRAGDALSGSLFLIADLAVAAGTLVGAYFLLPRELQFDRLDYFTSTHTQIKDAWQSAKESATLSSVLPMAGVIAGGTVLHKLLTAWSGKHAAGLAEKNIESGKVTFEPHALIMMSPGGHAGLAMGLKF